MKLGLIAVAVLLLGGVAAFVVMGIQARGGSAPGLHRMGLVPCGSRPNCVSSLAPPASSHYVEGFTFSAGDEDEAWSKMIEAIVGAGGVLGQNSPPYLSATFSSKIFGFVDDFECLLDSDAGVIHVRSGARVGYSDRNVNRARVERIRAILDKPSA